MLSDAKHLCIDFKCVFTFFEMLKMSIKGISVNYLRQRTTSSQLPAQIDIAFQVLPREMKEGSGCRDPKSNSESGEEQSTLGQESRHMIRLQSLRNARCRDVIIELGRGADSHALSTMQSPEALHSLVTVPRLSGHSHLSNQIRSP